MENWKSYTYNYSVDDLVEDKGKNDKHTHMMENYNIYI